MFILFISADFEGLRRKWPRSKDVRQTLMTLQMLYVLKTLTRAFFFFCLVQSKVEQHVYWTFPAKSSPKALKNMVYIALFLEQNMPTLGFILKRISTPATAFSARRLQSKNNQMQPRQSNPQCEKSGTLTSCFSHTLFHMASVPHHSCIY